MSALSRGWLPLRAAQGSRGGFQLPALMYGTAWKGEATAGLVQQALEAGFVAIDTAAQPRHYREDLAGQGIFRALAQGSVQRKDLFIQTKFTPPSGQDPETMPYRSDDAVAEQIRTSVAASIANLCAKQDPSAPAEGYIDCIVLHSPLDTLMDTLIAWHTLEEFVPHKVHYLGISNVTLHNLELIYDLMDVKPAVIQNRFFRQRDAYDRGIRKFCVDNHIVYQAFGTLTMNPHLRESQPVMRLAEAVGVDREVAIYCLILDLENVVILNGTSNHGRMKSDLAMIEQCRSWAADTTHQATWREISAQFKNLIDGDSVQ